MKLERHWDLIKSINVELKESPSPLIIFFPMEQAQEIKSPRRRLTRFLDVYSCSLPFPDQEVLAPMATLRAIPKPTEDLNPFRIAMLQFDVAAERLNLDAGLREVLRSPRRALTLS